MHFGAYPNLRERTRNVLSSWTPSSSFRIVGGHIETSPVTAYWLKNSAEKRCHRLKCCRFRSVISVEFVHLYQYHLYYVLRDLLFHISGKERGLSGATSIIIIKAALNCAINS